MLMPELGRHMQGHCMNPTGSVVVNVESMSIFRKIGDKDSSIQTCKR